MKNKSGDYLKETLKYLDNCVKYIQKKIPVKFFEFIGDFIKDENNIWWLINVKGFIIEDNQGFSNERYSTSFFFFYHILYIYLNLNGLTPLPEYNII